MDGAMEAASSVDQLDAEGLEALGEAIASFAVRIDVAEHALLTKLRRFDAQDGWARSGFLSCAQWLAWRIGIGPKAAREKVRVARALGQLGKVDALFGRGELSYSKVRAITRVATPETEQGLIDVALHATAAQVERLTRCYLRCVSSDAEGQLPRPSERRYVRRGKTMGGMIKIEIQLSPEEAAVVWDAIEAACDRAQASEGREGSVAGGEASAGAQDEPSAEAQEKSAVAQESSAVAQESSAEAQEKSAVAQEKSAGASSEASAEAWGANIPVPQPQPSIEPTFEHRRADAIVDLARAYLEQRPRTRGSGYELVLLTSKQQLEDGLGGVGGFLTDGTPVPIAVARMLACDSGCVDVTVDEHGELLDIGRRSRSIPAAIGRALWLRDGGCRVPGCGRRRHLHGHHLRGWAEGGATKLDNLVLLCSGHHRMIHEGELTLTREPSGALTFRTARGLSLTGAPERPISGEELDELERFFEDADLHLDPSTNMPRWDGRPLDLADSVSWLLMADPSRHGALARPQLRG